MKQSLSNNLIGDQGICNYIVVSLSSTINNNSYEKRTSPIVSVRTGIVNKVIRQINPSVKVKHKPINIVKVD